VRRMNARLKRPVTIQEIAADRSWERPVAYKWTKAAIEHKLVRLQPGTHPKNLKPLLPGMSAETRFLPHPNDVFRARKELGAFVRYIDPLTGRNKTLRRQTQEDDDF
jgi:hypothetical protein